MRPVKCQSSVQKKPLRCFAPTLEGIEDAARLLLAGGLVAFATETVYGLGADAWSADAIARLYAAKGRPAHNPLIAHVASAAAAMREGIFSPKAVALARAFWPGPLTLVTPLAPTSLICALARGGQKTVGLRVPAHDAALQLLARVGRPIAAPSANRSGAVSPVLARHVTEDLGDGIDAILDCGPAPQGMESTIVACLEEDCVLLRPGAIAREEIEAVVGPLSSSSTQTIAAPGMLSSHYAPRAPVRLNAAQPHKTEAILDFGGFFARDASGNPDMRRDLSPRGDLAEAAANLYLFLRELDAAGANAIAVAPIPETGLGEAMNDRLRRAAAPRKRNG